MNRHVLKLSQTKIVKRGFILISALLIAIGFNIKPVKAYVPQGSLQISYVNFYSMRNINPSTGTDLTNNEDWIVFDFNFDGFFSGSVDMTLTITKPVLSDPEHTAIGANAYRLSSTTTGNTSNVQQTDRWLFKFEDTQHFQFIYHLESSGGIYFGGNFGNITVDVTHSEDGSSVPSVTVDYTNILTDILNIQDDIYHDLDTLLQNIDTIKASVSGIASTLEIIKNNESKLLNEIVSNRVPWYSRNFFWILLRNNYLVEGTENATFKQLFGWYLNPPSSFPSSSYSFTIRNNKKLLIAFVTNSDVASKITFTKQDGSVSYEYTSVNVFPIAFNRTVKYVLLNELPPYGNYRITGFTNANYLLPIYFGEYDSAPEEVISMIGMDSNNSLLQKLVGLFQKNNEQNDEVLQSLEGINQNQQTINQSINNFNTDFNFALQNVPINETLQQIQTLNGAITDINNWWSLLWEKLGIFKLVIVIALILMLIRIFTGREK